MRRRTFLKSISTAASLTALSPFPGHARPENIADTSIIKPKRLKAGDTIGLVAPGSFISQKQLQASKENLQALGFNVACAKSILAKEGYLAGTDQQRADDLNEMFSRKDIDGIVAARGGYGCTRILPLLDYEMIRNNPKALVGYSDITALLFGIFRKTGLVCFHGPVGVSTFNKFSVDHFTEVLIHPHEKLALYDADEANKTPAYKPLAIRSGKARGKLVGGNLSLVVSVIGTPYDVDSAGKIIFLEEVGEEPYRVDRMITQMLEAGKFEKAAGVALGVFLDCVPKPDDSGVLSSFSVEEVLSTRLSNLNVPVLYGMSFGHISNKFTLPFGIEAELDSVEQKITLLEPAVI